MDLTQKLKIQRRNLIEASQNQKDLLASLLHHRLFKNRFSTFFLMKTSTIYSGLVHIVMKRQNLSIHGDVLMKPIFLYDIVSLTQSCSLFILLSDTLNVSLLHSF